MNRPWESELSLSPDWARDIIEEQFPALCPARVEQLAEGFDNALFRVNDEFVFRFPRHSRAVECLMAENRLLPHLALRLPLPIPNPIFTGGPHSGYPWPFSGYPMLRGDAATKVALTSEQRIASAVPLARFLRELHTIPASEAASMGAEEDRIHRLDVERRLPGLCGFLDRLESLDLVDTRPLRDLAFSTRPDLDNGKRVLVHGDFHSGNLLFDRESVTAVIDWGDVHIGNPAIDISVAFSLIPPEGRHLFRAAYGEIDDNTWSLARFKALYTSTVLLVYGHDTSNPGVIREAAAALAFVLED